MDGVTGFNGISIDYAPLNSPLILSLPLALVDLLNRLMLSFSLTVTCTTWVPYPTQ